MEKVVCAALCKSKLANNLNNSHLDTFIQNVQTILEFLKI